jgi:tRNA A37 methylthiotransferase MiaB
MYMVASEAADFMSADLEGGKIYFAQVVPRMGMWRARFSLEPITPSGPDWTNLDDWLRGSQRAVLNEEGQQWARDNQESVLGKETAYLKDWQKKTDQPHLRPQDGVTRF